MKIVGDIVQSNRIISFNEAKNKFRLKDGDFFEIPTSCCCHSI